MFRVAAPLAFGNNSASGDDTFGWVLAFCLLIFAVFTTAIWSLIDQELENYERLHVFDSSFVCASRARCSTMVSPKSFPPKCPILI